MKRVDEVMRADPATIDPEANVAAAIALILDRDARGLPVVEDGRVVGLVTLKDLVRQPPYRRVRDVMVQPVVTIAPDASINHAHQVMRRHRVSRLPVVEDGRLVGIVTEVELLQELGKLTDPLTELPWSGTLRDTAVAWLRDGHEIAIVFVDLDNFGAVNKAFGHVVGDRVIREVAAVLQAHADPRSDVVCRYAGDEFAIVTTRPSAESRLQAERIRDRIAQIEVGGLQAEHVVASIGIAGGKRTTERADIHYQATVDDLITLASRASTIAKRTATHIVHGHEIISESEAESADEAAPIARVRLGGVFLAVDGLRARAAVELEHRGERLEGERTGTGAGRAGLRLVAEATLDALGPILPPEWEVAVEEVALSTLSAGHLVTVALMLAGPGEPEHHLGAVFTGDDVWMAAARATLKALNRRLGVAAPVREPASSAIRQPL